MRLVYLLHCHCCVYSISCITIADSSESLQQTHTHMMTHTKLLAIYQTVIPSLHSDFTLSSWLLYSFVSPPVFVMYLSSHPDAPTTTPIPTTATTTTTTITTTLSYPEGNPGTVSPSHGLFNCVCVCVCMSVCVLSLIPLTALNHSIYLHHIATVAAILVCLLLYQWVKVTQFLSSFIKKKN